MDEFTDTEISLIRNVKYTLRKNIEMLIMTVEKLGSTYETAYYISGGCIGSLLRGETVNDYDVYFYDKAGADRITDLFKYDPSYTNYVKLAENDNFYREIKVGDKIITENAITLINGIQLITKHYGDPNTIRGTFDFVHCMPYYRPYFDELYISKQQYDLNMNKKLLVDRKSTRLNSSHIPLSRMPSSA